MDEDAVETNTNEEMPATTPTLSSNKAMRYRRVAQNDAETDEEQSDKKKRAERVERITAKIHALLWVAAAAALVAFTDFFSLLFSDRINRAALDVSIFLFAVVVGVFLYLAVWLPVVRKSSLPWEIEAPNMIPIATACSVASSIALMVAFWPVWGLLSPLFVTFLLLGAIFSTHFIPWPC